MCFFFLTGVCECEAVFVDMPNVPPTNTSLRTKCRARPVARAHNNDDFQLYFVINSRRALCGVATSRALQLIGKRLLAEHISIKFEPQSHRASEFKPE